MLVSAPCWTWRTKELCEDLVKRFAVAQQAGECYKTMSKEFTVHKSTPRQVNKRRFKTTVLGGPTQIAAKSNTLNRGCKSTQGIF